MDQRCVDTECVVVACFNFFSVGFHITSPFLFQMLVPSSRPNKKNVRKSLFLFFESLYGCVNVCCCTFFSVVRRRCLHPKS